MELKHRDPAKRRPVRLDPGRERMPVSAIAVFFVIAVLCVLADLIAPYGPDESDMQAVLAAPGAGHIFGTDTMGRDLFSLIWYGGRLSLYIGVLSAAISALIAIVYGSISGLAGERVDAVLMRFDEILLAVPQILVVIFLQAMIGTATPTTIAVVIGVTGWMNIAKVVRSEVRRIGRSEYVLAARMYGASTAYIIRKHLLPNFLSGIMFMIVMNVASAIGTEATLSFFGLGLPLDVVSWGSLLSMAQAVLLSGKWWLVVIPGIFLVAVIYCITRIGEYVRTNGEMLHSNL